jgi:hypothetical protein
VNGSPVGRLGHAQSATLCIVVIKCWEPVYQYSFLTTHSLLNTPVFADFTRFPTTYTLYLRVIIPNPTIKMKSFAVAAFAAVAAAFPQYEVAPPAYNTTSVEVPVYSTPASSYAAPSSSVEYSATTVECSGPTEVCSSRIQDTEFLN